MHRTNVKDGTSLGIREVSKMHHDESSQPKAEKRKQPSLVIPTCFYVESLPQYLYQISDVIGFCILS